MGKESWVKAALVWAAIIVLFVLFFKFLYKPHEDVQKTYPQFQSYVEKQAGDPQSIVNVSIRSDNLRGDEITAKLKDNTSVTTYGPADDGVRAQLRKDLESKKIPINYEKPDEGSAWMNFISMWLPLIIIVVFMLLFLRNMQGAGGKAMSFGKSRAKLQSDGANKVTFKDVAGIEEVKQECTEIVAFLKDHKKFQEIGARIPKGVLMMGAPGTGKTLLARAIAGEAGVPFFTISGSDFVEMFVGVGASRVRDLFENAKKNSPCIIFIDEIDAVGRHRGAGVGGGHDEREQTLNQLLVEMDGFEANDAVIVIAATNRPDVLDPALLRPGRFDRRVMVGLPDVRGRKEILAVHMKKIRHTEDINVERIALGTPGFSGADLENLCNEAALMAARNGMKRVTEKDFESAKDKILMGPERRSAVLPKETIKVTAYHEAGHALVSHFLKSRENVHKITVIPRGQALGVTAYLPKEDVYGYSKEDLLTKIAFAMGGRAAEEIKFSQFTTGASNDIQQATELARRMVCQFGMSRLGPINFGQKNENPFLGRDWGESRNYSETLAHEIDMEVSKIINTQYELAKQVLVDHMDVFERVSNILLDVETLDSEEFLAVVNNGATSEQIKEIQAKKTLSGSEGGDNANKQEAQSNAINSLNTTPTPA
ncbi:ATP-dependent zinc metalloprotease FtsH [Silvanigrella paludirubra]|jgi:cell division protease FtsH|uniref:ATP-dependent zinc metalloprotease FtsH n=1 Tax=Silvanigrella paludirubra TaxID=2499159 RepID=A0A6N6VSB8_9BACT|nr:ATP-dependent zinc metalloprotease FtsH [Silvanigrella paludirubra]KAB8039022.1 ATP-dependent zinc metalloprotease FtsH [Silvanigrella paludirubra]